MTKISRIKVDPKNLSFFINNFWNILTLLEDKEQVQSFLKDLLTHTEMKMLAKRIQVAKMLLEGHNYQTIRNHVKVTDATIAKMSNLLTTNGEGLRLAVKHLQMVEAEIEEKRLQAMPSIKKKYGVYFLPEKLVDVGLEKYKTQKKKKSVKKDFAI